MTKLSNRIGVPKSWLKCGKTACKWHMKAGIFEMMTPKKQVELLEHVAKSMLGLEGLKIVVACDKVRQGSVKEKMKEITFADLGEECLRTINGNLIKQKYPKIEGEEFSKRLHEERIKWVKDHEKID